METCTALTLIFPESTHSKINQIRSVHDKAYPKWPPHINFIFPFVPLECFDEIASKLTHLGEFGEFNLVMNQIGYFDQGTTTTFHLKPENDAKLQRLFQLIREALPDIPVKRDVFHPHLTLGQFPKSEIESRKRDLEKWLGDGVSIIVDRIHLIWRDKNVGTPFEIKREIKLVGCPLTDTTHMSLGQCRTIAKSSDTIKFADCDIAAFIDNSGSTGGARLTLEHKFVKSITDQCRKSFDKLVFWNNTVIVRPNKLRSEGGTTPQCIFTNAQARQFFTDADIIIFTTDGEIYERDVSIFANQLKNYLNKILFICVFVSSGLTDLTNLNVSVMSPMMIGTNVLCLYLDTTEQIPRILATKGAIATKFPSPSSFVLSKLPVFNVKQLLELELNKINIPHNCLLLGENETDYIVIELSELAKADVIPNLDATSWEILIQHAMVTGTVDKIRDLISRSRNLEIQTVKRECQTKFDFSWIKQRDQLMDQMAKAYVEGQTDLQQECAKQLERIRDSARLEELTYAEFVKKNLDVVRGKWDRIRGVLATFDNSRDKFSLGNFASNRAARAQSITDEEIDLDNIILEGGPEIECIIHLDKGPAVLWLNQLNDIEQTTNDFCLNFPLAHYPNLQKLLVNNPVCGHCAAHYLKYSKVSVYREPIHCFIPANWTYASNRNIAHHNLCTAFCGGKNLRHVKMLLLSMLDDNEMAWLEYKSDMIDSMIHHIVTTDTFSEEGNKMTFVQGLAKIINDDENLLRQPFSACVRLLDFCYRYGIADKMKIVDQLRKRFAYVMVETFCLRTKNGNLDPIILDLQKMCFEFFCGMPMENSAHFCQINDPGLCHFLGAPNILMFLERICNTISLDKAETISEKIITNIIWHLQKITTHERPLTIYTKLSKSSTYFRNLGLEPNNLLDLINKDKFGRYKKVEPIIVPSYACYNGEFSGPTKFYFYGKPLWKPEWHNTSVAIDQISTYLRQNLGRMMTEKYGSYYPCENSNHFLLHRTVAKVLESSKFKTVRDANDEMILDCILELAKTGGQYGNIYQENLLGDVVAAVHNFCQVRRNCLNMSTGNYDTDRSFEHKVKCELIMRGMNVDGNMVFFEQNKMIEPPNLVRETYDLENIRDRVQRLFDNRSA